MSFFSKIGSEPIFENLSVILCSLTMSFSISKTVVSAISSDFNISSQPIKDESGVPI